MSDPPAALPIPQESDSLLTLVQKLTALRKVIEANQSIALATAYAATPLQNRTAAQNAINQMTPNELEAWTAYTNNTVNLPSIDWATATSLAPTSPKPLRIAQRRAEALRYLYATDQAGPEHAVWFVQNHLPCLPLLKAITRVLGAEKDLCGEQAELSAMQWADLQTINKVLSVSGIVVARSKRGAVPRGIGLAQQVLGMERDMLRGLRKRAVMDEEVDAGGLGSGGRNAWNTGIA